MALMNFVDHGAGGSPEVLRLARCERPVPRADEVLIKVAFAGVNRPDCGQRMGRYPPPPGASPIIGLEVAGHVVQVGPGVSRWKVGDAVCALTPGGGYAQYCATPADHCLAVPAGMPLEQAAALPETCFTVLDNVFNRSSLKPGESFLVHGGSGGIGTAAIQMARAFGAQVLTTVGSAEKKAYCLEAGAHCVINYREQDFVPVAMDFTHGRGVDVILDMVAGPYLRRDLEALALDGRIAVIAFMGGSEAAIDVMPILRKRATITGSTLRPCTVEQKAGIARALEAQWWPHLCDLKLRPVLHHIFDLGDAGKAHALMESSAHVGKIVLAVDPS